MLERRELTRDDVVRAAERHRNWGTWGPDDELGSANYVTPEQVAAEGSEIRRGVVFSLAMPMDNTGPMQGVNGRVNPQHRGRDDHRAAQHVVAALNRSCCDVMPPSLATCTFTEPGRRRASNG
jgi:hypothetical protein